MYLIKTDNKERDEGATNIPLMSIANNGRLNVFNPCLAAKSINLHHIGTWVFFNHNF